MTTSPSGAQFTISHGDQRATIVEVGGGVRAYAVGARPVLDPYPIDAQCDGAHGAPLIPWPNRLEDGTYRFDGVDHQVALTEPDKHNAIHGLMRWRPWQAVEHTDRRVVMAARLHPMAGYPFTLDVQIDYELGEGGLTVAATASNRGDRPCPYGFGQHPYLSPGGGTIDGCTLQVDAETRVLTDPERQLPMGREAVDATAHDFRRPQLLGDQAIDDPFTDLTRDVDGRAWARLGSPGSGTVELWVDELHPFIEVYTGDGLAPDRRRRGLGAEPMTCPPNAFHTGEGVIALDPGQSVTTRWGVRLTS